MSTPEVAILRRRCTLLVALILSTLTVQGCGFSDSRERAERHADKYFLAMRAGDVGGALSAYSPAFFEQTPRETWSSQLRTVQSRLGPVASHELVSWNVNSRVGTGAGTYVTLVYAVTYRDGSSKEQLVLFSPPDGDFAILGHHLQLPDFPPLEPTDAAST